MGRDVGHSYADVAGLSTLVQTIYAQGTKVDPVSGARSAASNAVNMFNFLDDRLLAGTTYLLKYHLGYNVLWTPAWANQSSTIIYYDTINADGRGRIDAFYSVLYNYYKYIENRDMSWGEVQVFGLCLRNENAGGCGKGLSAFHAAVHSRCGKDSWLEQQDHVRSDNGIDGNGGRCEYDLLKLVGRARCAGV